MIIGINLKSRFGIKMSIFCHIKLILLWASFHYMTKLCNSLAAYHVNILPNKLDIVMGALSIYYQNMQLTSSLLILIQRIITFRYGMSCDKKTGIIK